MQPPQTGLKALYGRTQNSQEQHRRQQRWHTNKPNVRPAWAGTTAVRDARRVTAPKRTRFMRGLPFGPAGGRPVPPSWWSDHALIPGAVYPPPPRRGGGGGRVSRSRRRVPGGGPAPSRGAIPNAASGEEAPGTRPGGTQEPS